jgi:hypothetical protein
MKALKELVEAGKIKHKIGAGKKVGTMFFGSRFLSTVFDEVDGSCRPFSMRSTAGATMAGAMRFIAEHKIGAGKKVGTMFFSSRFLSTVFDEVDGSCRPFSMRSTVRPPSAGPLREPCLRWNYGDGPEGAHSGSSLRGVHARPDSPPN